MKEQQEQPVPALERLNMDLKRTIDLLEGQMAGLNEKLQKISYFNKKCLAVEDSSTSNIEEIEAPSALVFLEGSVHRLQKVSDQVGGYIRHLNEII